MRITSATTYTVGNPWKNWVFVRLDTDEGIYGVGEGTANAFAASIATTIHELEDTYIGLDPTQVELLAERMHRDVYTDGGQVHRAAPRRDRDRMLGHRRQERRPTGARTARRARPRPRARLRERLVPGRAHARGDGRSGARRGRQGVYRTQARPLRPHLAHDRARRGVARDRPHPGGPRCHRTPRGSPGGGPLPLRRRPGHPLAQRMASSDPLWFEEPVPHHDVDSVVEVALHSPVPIATGESLASPGGFAALLRRGGVRIWQPDPMHLGGIWPTRGVIAMANASDIAVAPHSAAGPDLLGRSACSSLPAARTCSSRSCSTSSTRAGRARSSTSISRPTAMARSRSHSAPASASISTGSASARTPRSEATDPAVRARLGAAQERPD